jgi:hypothetical protein
MMQLFRFAVTEVTQCTHFFFENVQITCIFFINRTGEIVLQTDRKKKGHVLPSITSSQSSSKSLHLAPYVHTTQIDASTDALLMLYTGHTEQNQKQKVACVVSACE